MSERERREALERARPTNSPDPFDGLDRPFVWSDTDMMRLRLAYKVRFDEDLPRSETLLCVAAEGARIVLARRTAPAGVVQEGWRTMDSAPKDGSVIDLWVQYQGSDGVRRDYRAACGSWRHGYGLPDDQGCWVDSNWNRLEWPESDVLPKHGQYPEWRRVTHWQPLPGAPE